MAYTKAQLLAAALELEPAEREALAEELLLTLPPINTGDIDEACAEEAERRTARYERGESTGIPVDEAIERIIRKYKA